MLGCKGMQKSWLWGVKGVGRLMEGVWEGSGGEIRGGRREGM